MLVYRPPNIQVADTIILLEAIESVLNNHANVVLLGDFNFPSINWLTLTAECGVKNALLNNFIDLCASYDLYQIILEPMRNRHYLDLILTLMHDKFFNAQPVPSTGGSGHNAVNCKFFTASSNSELSQ